MSAMVTSTASNKDVELLEANLQHLTLQAIKNHPTKTKEQFALEFFELASKKENAGSLNEAVNYYRKAFKIDEKVDIRYREKLFAEQPSPEIRKLGIPNANSLLLKKMDLSQIKVRPLLKSFHDSVMYPMDESKPVFLNSLPDEIISTIMEILVRTDTPSWFQFSMSCKRLAYLGLSETNSWRLLCNLIYPNQKYNEDEIVLNNITKDQSQMVGRLWDNDWLNMLQLRPFVKFHGLYISVVNYQREGGRSEFSNAWNLPFRIITYYRYFRFYPDGTCLKLMTIFEPSEIVNKFNKDWKKNFGHSEWEKVYEGEWTVSIDGMIRCESSGALPNYKFIDEFQITNGGKFAKHHKLDWIQMGYQNLETGDTGTFGIGNERSFAFSRVRSYDTNENDTHEGDVLGTNLIIRPTQEEESDEE